VLPAIRVPTLVLYRRGRFDEEQKALDVAARIPTGRAMRVSGKDYSEIYLSPDVPGEIERDPQSRGSGPGPAPRARRVASGGGALLRCCDPAELVARSGGHQGFTITLMASRSFIAR
jgi:hypothetical protein